MKIGFGIAAIVLAGAGAFAALHLSAPKPIELKTSFEYPQPQPLAPFVLQDQHGNAFTNAQLKGKWSLFFVGYTSCPDVCPTTMAKLAAAYPQLSKHAPLQIVFLSVDPQRDPPAKLLNYVNFFNPEFVAVTGEHQQLLPITRGLGFVYAMVGAGENYQVDHSSSLALVSPQGEKIAIIKPQSSSPGKLPQISNSDLIDDVIQLIAKHKS